LLAASFAPTGTGQSLRFYVIFVLAIEESEGESHFAPDPIQPAGKLMPFTSITLFSRSPRIDTEPLNLFRQRGLAVFIEQLAYRFDGHPPGG